MPALFYSNFRQNDKTSFHFASNLFYHKYSAFFFWQTLREKNSISWTKRGEMAHQNRKSLVESKKKRQTKPGHRQPNKQTKKAKKHVQFYAEI